MSARGWNIGDAYRNTTRDEMPTDETITRFGDRLVAVAELAIAENGGARITKDGRAVYRIRAEKPTNVERLTDPAARFARLRSRMKPGVEADPAGEEPLGRAREGSSCVGRPTGEDSPPSAHLPVAIHQRSPRAPFGTRNPQDRLEACQD